MYCDKLLYYCYDINLCILQKKIEIYMLKISINNNLRFDTQMSNTIGNPSNNGISKKYFNNDICNYIDSMDEFLMINDEITFESKISKYDKKHTDNHNIDYSLLKDKNCNDEIIVYCNCTDKNHHIDQTIINKCNNLVLHNYYNKTFLINNLSSSMISLNIKYLYSDKHYEYSLNNLPNTLNNLSIEYANNVNCSYNYLPSSIIFLKINASEYYARRNKKNNDIKCYLFPNKIKYLICDFSSTNTKFRLPYNTRVLCINNLNLMKGKARKLKILSCQTCILNNPKNKINDVDIFRVALTSDNNFEFDYKTICIDVKNRVRNFNIKDNKNIIFNVLDNAKSECVINLPMPNNANIFCVNNSFRFKDNKINIAFRELPNNINYLDCINVEQLSVNIYKKYNINIAAIISSCNDINIPRYLLKYCNYVVKNNKYCCDLYDKENDTHINNKKQIEYLINKYYCEYVTII